MHCTTDPNGYFELKIGTPVHLGLKEMFTTILLHLLVGRTSNNLGKAAQDHKCVIHCKSLLLSDRNKQ